MLDINPQPVQLKFLEAEERIVFFGGGAGGGKTWSILVDNLQGVHDPDYFSVFFRNTTVELETNLWPEAVKMYEPILKDEDGKWIGKARIKDKDKTIIFPSGARSKFSYLQYDKDADAWYGSEITKAYFDEFQRFSEYQFNIIRSRNRSRANVTKGIRCTLNPDPQHFMFDWVKPFIHEDGDMAGFPDLSLSGKTRYFILHNGQLHSSWDEDELKAIFEGKTPQTYTYIPATLLDNKVLMEMDEDYKNNLDAMPEKQRNQLLLGSWTESLDSGMYFKRDWLKKADKVPLGCRTIRAYDLAASEPTDSNPYPDYTASIKMSKDRDGYYYIWGDNIDSAKDVDSNITGRFRKRAGDRDKVMLAQAKHDGVDVHLVLPQDSGAAGKDSFENKVKYFSEEGFVVKKDVSVSNQSKLTKFEPFASAAENGIVYIVESTFNKETLEWFYIELEAFNGERSTARRKDEAVDICATGFNYLARMKVLPKLRMANSGGSPTSLNDIKQLKNTN